MRENALSPEARKIFRVGVVMAAMFGSWAVLPATDSEEAQSFIHVPGPIIMPIRAPVRVIPRTRSVDEVPWFEWHNVG